MCDGLNISKVLVRLQLPKLILWKPSKSLISLHLMGRCELECTNGSDNAVILNSLDHISKSVEFYTKYNLNIK